MAFWRYCLFMPLSTDKSKVYQVHIVGYYELLVSGMYGIFVCHFLLFAEEWEWEYLQFLANLRPWLIRNKGLPWVAACQARGLFSRNATSSTSSLSTSSLSTSSSPQKNNAQLELFLLKKNSAERWCCESGFSREQFTFFCGFGGHCHCHPQLRPPISITLIK